VRIPTPPCASRGRVLREPSSLSLDALKADHPRELAAVDGIGLSGQMRDATLLDANFKPLRPRILWNDGRSAAECRMLEQRWPALRATTGNKAMPGYTAPKLVWVAKHEPEIFAATGHAPVYPTFWAAIIRDLGHST
jgi:xylulokinase